MLITQRSAQEVVGDQCGHLVIGSLVQVLLGNVRSVAAHGVVRVLPGELEGVVAAGTASAVGDFASETSDEAGTTGLKIGHGVQVAFARGTHASSLEAK